MRRLAGRAAVWASAPPCPNRAATPAQVWLRAASAPGGAAVGEEAVGILLRLQQVAVGCGWGKKRSAQIKRWMGSGGRTSGG